MPDAILKAGEVLGAATMPRVAVILYRDSGLRIATGNLVEHAGRHFILSCHHVLRAALRSNEFGIRLLDGTLLRPNDVELAFDSDDEIDQAALLVKSPIQPASCFELADFLEVETFSRLDFDANNLFLTGFPGDLIDVQADAITAVPFSYMTIPFKRQPKLDRELLCDFPKLLDGIEMATSSVSVPSPKGLSGSLLLLAPHWERGRIWHAGLSKVIGVQSAANLDEYLVCTKIDFSIRRLREYA